MNTRKSPRNALFAQTRATLPPCFARRLQLQVRPPCQPRPQRNLAAYVQEQRELAWTECVKNAHTGTAELAWSIMMGSSGMDDTLTAYVDQIRKLQKKTYYIAASESTRYVRLWRTCERFDRKILQTSTK